MVVKVLSLFDGMACLIEATRRNSNERIDG